MFLVKREESRDFNVFLGVFLDFFGVWEREKMQRLAGQKENFRKNMCPLCLGRTWGYL